MLGYPPRQEISFVESTATLTEENYVNFLKNRKKFIVHRFITSLYEH